MEGESSNTEPKPPPKFVSGVKNIKPLVELLNAIAQHKYILKTLYKQSSESATPGKFHMHNNNKSKQNSIPISPETKEDSE
ncbi:hypothetical protein B7P43_G12141 [Cryptotermes secundus]|uniref:Uncharacterized protein n=1 Tax=Cryptotermes secundus TaxID=105785 RepID=A0A2J7R2H3_9NEOP|nr:hypothetical protein B7P43_G12141 [Cryptotermes secundus]